MSRNDESEWSDWGSWNLSKTYSRYYRQRQDVNGNIETMWAIEIDASQRQEAGEENETGPSNSASNSEYASTKSDTQVGAFERPEDEMGYGEHGFCPFGSFLIPFVLFFCFSVALLSLALR